MKKNFYPFYSLLLSFSLICIFLFYSCNSESGNKDDKMNEMDGVFYEVEDFAMGADLSYVNAILETGTRYRNAEGVEQNPYEIFRNLGTNLVRVRKWHTPSWQQNLYGAVKYHEWNDVIRTLSESKKAGMNTLLNLHYSDNWADPHKQEIPAAWQGLSLSVLQDSIYDYTTNYLQHLASLDLVPQYIQIGNENNQGMCWPTGRINNNNFSNFCRLLNAGCRAVRDFSETSVIKPKIIIHFAQFQGAKWWIQGVLNSGIEVDYDILGISHYYKWTELNEMQDISSSIRELNEITNKDLWVVETAFPWTTEFNDNYANIMSPENIPAGFQISKEGQNNYLRELTKAIINGGGKGIIYWEPAWISSPLRDQWGTGSSWENATYFDYQNKVHQTLSFMKEEYEL
jgi:arabinogalactan endo-1,4-beta-galactosidase